MSARPIHIYLVADSLCDREFHQCRFVVSHRTQHGMNRKQAPSLEKQNPDLWPSRPLSVPASQVSDLWPQSLLKTSSITPSWKAPCNRHQAGPLHGGSGEAREVNRAMVHSVTWTKRTICDHLATVYLSRAVDSDVMDPIARTWNCHIMESILRPRSK